MVCSSANRACASCVSATSTAACSASRVALALRTWSPAWSTDWLETKREAASGFSRVTSRWAADIWVSVSAVAALAWASVASAVCTASCGASCSWRARIWPFFTASPSWT